MFRHLTQLYGAKLGASDGDIGHVKDFYFDDQSWIVRYLVVDTGSWLTGRLVLLSPHAFAPEALGNAVAHDRSLAVNLTRKQIEGSPAIDTHRPVSRQFEADYYRHYGWPTYWADGGMWGAADFPTTETGTAPAGPLHHGHNQRDDVHLRSTKAVTGYHLQATDGEVGSVRDFLFDGKIWTIRELIIDTGHWYARRELRLHVSKVARVSYEEARVFVNLPRSELHAPASNGEAKARTIRHSGTQTRD
ncbi:MAG: PRC-barrel domain containing protein [Opitutae bacterium]|nr:PRC-barrel domain containing protein [Opitutae bacterium]